jgi:hypothetical protein
VSQFFLTDGLRTGTISIEVSSGAIVKGSTKLMGKATVRSNASKLGNAGTYIVLDAPATEVVSATANVGALLIDGVEAATAIQSIKLDIDGSLREQRAVGSKFAAASRPAVCKSAAPWQPTSRTARCMTASSTTRRSASRSRSSIRTEHLLLHGPGVQGHERPDRSGWHRSGCHGHHGDQGFP